MAISKEPIKRAVERALDELPAEKVAEVLDFAQFLKARWDQEAAQGVAVSEPTRLVLRTVPASHLDRLVGLVAWGGDAVADAERLSILSSTKPSAFWFAEPTNRDARPSSRICWML